MTQRMSNGRVLEQAGDLTGWDGCGQSSSSPMLVLQMINELPENGPRETQSSMDLRSAGLF